MAIGHADDAARSAVPQLNAQLMRMTRALAWAVRTRTSHFDAGAGSSRTTDHPEPGSRIEPTRPSAPTIQARHLDVSTRIERFCFPGALQTCTAVSIAALRPSNRQFRRPREVVRPHRSPCVQDIKRIFRESRDTQPQKGYSCEVGGKEIYKWTRPWPKHSRQQRTRRTSVQSVCDLDFFGRVEGFLVCNKLD